MARDRYELCEKDPSEELVDGVLNPPEKTDEEVWDDIQEHGK